MNLNVVAFVIAVAIAYLVTPLIRMLAIKRKVMVRPGGRRVHTTLMPLWGGIAIYGAFAIASLLFFAFGNLSAQQHMTVAALLVSGAFVVIMGLLDDMKEFSAAIQAGTIIAAAVILGLFGVRIQFLSDPFHPRHMIPLAKWLSWTLSIMWIFLVTKTIDFMDGLDGLAAGIGAIAAGVLGIMAHYSGQPHVALVAAALSGACVGFLRFNFNPAKIFMGTGGSQFIGFALAAISIIGAFKSAAAMAIALPVLVLGVPIFDGIFVILHRLLNGQPMHVADKTHLHHRLIARGFTHKQAVLFIYLISGFFGMCALALTLLWYTRHR
jgi:UDP-GlcNAc:undecaprenyl-phosphate GlcNAc-1-phosphate transferase